MIYKKYENVYAVRIDRGEEVVSSLLKMQESEGISAAIVEGLGAADYVKFGLYDVGSQKFLPNELAEPLEVTSITGNLTRQEGKPYLHAHINVADARGHVSGGHLIECRISGTAELFVTPLAGTIGRRKDDMTGTGLNLFDFH